MSSFVGLRLRGSGLRDRLGGVRARTTLVAVVVVAVVLALGVLAMMAVLRAQLRSGLDDGLMQAATSRADLIDQGAAPDSLVDVVGDESMIWVGAVDGSQLAVGGRYQPTAMPLVDLTDRPVTVSIDVIEVEPDGPGERERKEMRVVRADAATGTIVMAGTELDVVDETVGRLGRLFLIAVPLVILLVLALTWTALGRALDPVERIRREAAEIGGADLTRRVPLPESSDEISRLAETMNEMLDRLEAHDQSLRRFTADASHELKSPVANLRVLVDTHRSNDPSWPELQANLSGETDRLRGLIDNLLYLATHDESRGGGLLSAVDTESVAVDDLVFAEAEMLAATTDHRIDVSGVGPAVVQGRRADLARMLRNLVDNAARHASTTVRLAVRTVEDGPDGGAVVVEVADDGRGIPPSDRVRIFERLTRLDEARDRDRGGAGLGLAIVQAAAEAHGARILVDYENGSTATGARFVVTFPTSTGSAAAR